MCGIAGYLTFENPTDPINVLSGMGQAIFSRGPDSAGQWFNLEENIGLAHQRLAIVDLSPAGHQPMHSNTGRYVISFNGEIYNHNELREKLSKINEIAWRGHSDTETLLAGFEAWGIQETIKKTVGMFAIAIWDKDTKTLTLTRDRLGEKPLYYGWQGNTFLFGSELKAIKSHPSFESEIDKNSISLFLRYSYIPAPYCIYKNIKKLMPGTLAIISLNNPAVEIINYWSLQQRPSLEGELFNSYNAAIIDLEHQLRESIRLQMMADVPLGAFLSGGVDSSTIVALMQAQSNRPVKTFSIGFHEAQYNEAHYAKAVADHLKTEHTELYVSAEDALGVIPSLANIYDEPFADASQIPTYLVAKMAREHVTVSLSGDAGDELFCGYNRYLMAQKVWSILSKVPISLRKIVSRCITSIPAKTWDNIAGIILKLKPHRNAKARTPLSDRLYKIAKAICAKDMPDLYLRLVSIIQSPENYVLNAIEPNVPFSKPAEEMNIKDDIDKMMFIDIHSYLPNDILTKVDRAAMAVSLETRVPLLDHRIVEFAWSLPLKFKINKKNGKLILREILYKYVPKELIERPKMGFAIPIDSWLRGPLRNWAETLLNEQRLNNEGFLNSIEVRKLWADHLSGRQNYQYQLWNILMFQLWLENNRHST